MGWKSIYPEDGSNEMFVMSKCNEIKRCQEYNESRQDINEMIQAQVVPLRGLINALQNNFEKMARALE
jgi:hypothetical protein